MSVVDTEDLTFSSETETIQIPTKECTASPAHIQYKKKIRLKNLSFLYANSGYRWLLPSESLANLTLTMYSYITWLIIFRHSVWYNTTYTDIGSELGNSAVGFSMKTDNWYSAKTVTESQRNVTDFQWQQCLYFSLQQTIQINILSQLKAHRLARRWMTSGGNAHINSFIYQHVIYNIVSLIAIFTPRMSSFA